MARIHYLAPKPADDTLNTDVKLPTHLPIAIYYRQSTEAQIGNISTTLQTVDMVKYLRQQGWQESNIIMLDMDAGVSGTKRIDERPGMSKLFGLITQGEIGAVACQDEDRLFRDVTQIQVNIFIEACRAHQVLVITPAMAYDFAHPQLGVFHARQFRFKSEMAADYLTSLVYGRLHAAKRALVLQGKWAGGTVTTGYMVDMRPKLPDGAPNANCRRYTVFAPYAEVVAAYFRIFLACDGNVTQTLRHIRQHGPFYPDPAECPPPQGYSVNYKIRRNRYGWSPFSIPSLIQMFTNAIFIGHWVADSVVVRWHNHPAIVDEDTFYRAFNHLSTVTLDGSANPDHPETCSRRPSTPLAERQEDVPLFDGKIFSWLNEQLKPTAAHWIIDSRTYYYKLIDYDGLRTVIWTKQARFLDETVCALLLAKLRSSFDANAWQAAVDDQLHAMQAEEQHVTAQLRQLEHVMANLVASLAMLTTPALIGAVEQRFQAAEAEQERLAAEQAALAAQLAELGRLQGARTSYAQALAQWDTLPHAERRQLVQLFVKQIVAAKAEDRILDLTIYWEDGTTDQLRLPRAAPTGTKWLPQETAQLIALVEAGADQMEIARAFPVRTWYRIQAKYLESTGQPLNRSRLKRDRPIKTDESYAQYVARIAQQQGELTRRCAIAAPGKP